MKPRTCPEPAALSRAFSEGADAEQQAHLASCASCSAQWQALDELRQFSKLLPVATRSEEATAQARARLLLAAQQVQSDQAAQASRSGPQSSRRLGLLMVAAATLLVLFAGNRLWSKRQQSAQLAQQFRGTLYPQGVARFTHQRTASEEWVRLSEGTLRVEVRPLAAGERFRLFTGDGEVEVRGTAFEAQVQKDKLRHVLVLHGLVEVRPYARAAVLLGPGGNWQAEAEVPVMEHPAGLLQAQQPVPPASAPASPTAASVAKEPSREAALGIKPQAVATATKTAPSVAAKPATQAPRASVAVASAATINSTGPGPALKPAIQTTSAKILAAATRTPAEEAFADGWTSLRHSQYEVAATAFARAIAIGGGEPILEDARFWRGVALARASHSAKAIEALREFMTHHQASPRLGEAASILGWLLLKAGQLDEAERRFQTALRDARPEVSDSARAGLQSVTAAKNQPAPRQ